MASPSGRFVIVFNGEVYNHRDLRRDLEAHSVPFRGHSDTEVIAAAFEHWGVEESVSRFNGMFGIAAWDRRDRRLHLIRDRMGIKPLYYFRANGMIAFASELRALMRAPNCPRDIDPGALGLYLRYLCIPAPRALFRGVRKLPQGTILTVNTETMEDEVPRPYWDLRQIYGEGLEDPFLGSPEDAVDELEALLKDSIRLRMEADVPVGALLSGGIDSSTIVALLQELRSEPARTYSVSFPDTEHDEGAFAADVARRLQSHRHTELQISEADLINVVPRIPDLFDEPLADPSQIPTYLICKAAREDVIVALSGDGGDEIFGGYNRYRFGRTWIRRAVRYGPFPRAVAAPALERLGTGAPAKWVERIARCLPASDGIRLPAEKMSKLGALLRGNTEAEMYRTLRSTRWNLLLPPDVEPVISARTDMELLDWMMLSDQGSYLADDLLAKVDRASMATSLEARVPLLDHRIVAFSWRLPATMKLRDGKTKWILRQVLARRLPEVATNRPKVGFTVPLADWLSGPLRSWAEESLLDSRNVLTDVLPRQALNSVWREFLSGRRDAALAVWAAAVFVRWEDHWRGMEAPATS